MTARAQIKTENALRLSSRENVGTDASYYQGSSLNSQKPLSLLNYAKYGTLTRDDSECRRERRQLFSLAQVFIYVPRNVAMTSTLQFPPIIPKTHPFKMFLDHPHPQPLLESQSHPLSNTKSSGYALSIHPPASQSPGPPPPPAVSIARYLSTC